MTTVRIALALSVTCTALLVACGDSRRPEEARTTAPAPPATSTVPGTSAPATPPATSTVPAPVDSAGGPVTSPPVAVPQASRDEAAKKAPEAAESSAAATAPPPAARETAEASSASPGATSK